ncbi:MAG: hypothetical protein KDJ16_08585 [Hyphomicrobiales bacterium]|nr:hypothetical protein [Hyphomicrobiales bacterium]
MSIDGIWTGEILGPYGWENSGVYVLENGRLLGGNNRHYSTGKYSFTDNKYEARISVHYYGPPRAMFGEAKELFDINVTGEYNDGVIDAKVVRVEGPTMEVIYRMTKRMDVPKF